MRLSGNPYGRLSGIIHGLLGIADGLILVLSIGFISAELQLDYARFKALQKLKRLKEKGKH